MCVLDGERIKVFTSTALAVASADGSVSDQLQQLSDWFLWTTLITCTFHSLKNGDHRTDDPKASQPRKCPSLHDFTSRLKNNQRTTINQPRADLQILFSTQLARTNPRVYVLSMHKAQRPRSQHAQILESTFSACTTPRVYVLSMYISRSLRSQHTQILESTFSARTTLRVYILSMHNSQSLCS